MSGRERRNVAARLGGGIRGKSNGRRTSVALSVTS